MPNPNKKNLQREVSELGKDASLLNSRLQAGGIQPGDEAVEQAMTAMENRSAAMLQQTEGELEDSFNAVDKAFDPFDGMQQVLGGAPTGVDSDEVDNLMNELLAKRVSDLPTPRSERTTALEAQSDDALAAGIVKQAMAEAEAERVIELMAKAPLSTEQSRAKARAARASAVGNSAPTPADEGGRKPALLSAATPVRSTSTISPTVSKASPARQPTKLDRLNRALEKRKEKSRELLARGWEKVAKAEAAAKQLEKQAKKQARLEARIERQQEQLGFIASIGAAITAIIKAIAAFFAPNPHLDRDAMQRTFAESGEKEVNAMGGSLMTYATVPHELGSELGALNKLSQDLASDETFEDEVELDQTAQVTKDQRADFLAELHHEHELDIDASAAEDDSPRGPGGMGA
jgi:hypothetical protein